MTGIPPIETSKKNAEKHQQLEDGFRIDCGIEPDLAAVHDWRIDVCTSVADAYQRLASDKVGLTR